MKGFKKPETNINASLSKSAVSFLSPASNRMKVLDDKHKNYHFSDFENNNELSSCGLHCQTVQLYIDYNRHFHPSQNTPDRDDDSLFL